MKAATPALVVIAAVARNRAIGRDNALLWRDPEDHKHFRRTTMGCPVIMGRRTWDSLPDRFRPLPGRRNIVLTRDRTWQAQGCEAAHSLHDALSRCADAPKVFVIGGGELYAEAIPLAHELMLTEIDADFDGNVFFPPWREQFKEISRETHRSADGTRFDFVTYHRKS